ncbi:phenylalanine--tRNA ligase subunit alpha [Candidatus Babeliales bacterium]|nr:phenylalanine--tRNA ligase subunit alpha [Candidatus Babeliales bacterium]
MRELIDKAKVIALELKQAAEKVVTIKEVDDLRVQFMGREGCLTLLIKELKDLDSLAKREVGPVLNQIRVDATEIFRRLKEDIEKREAEAANMREKGFDVSAYQPKGRPDGTRHIYSKFIEDIEDIFMSMGFSIFDGPEVETDFYNFQALNIPQNHPARDMQDTFWFEKDKKLLRTHTSNVQIHAMQKYGVPIAGVCTGRVYRYEATDATHDCMFTQCEGLLVDKNVSISQLLGTVKKFLQRLFDSKKLKIRVRPGFFPFVEPGLEVDMSCVFCKDGCSVCKKTTWIELMGAGLVHPNVLRAVKVDPEVYSGFAFGVGIERLAMLRYGIDDIRLFHSGRVKFLQQF